MNNPLHSYNPIEEHSKILEYRNKGCTAIKEQDIVIDDELVQEIQLSGSDKRFGVNLIARPTSEVLDHIEQVKNVLKAYDPEQYYYPPHDLHLTVLEICYNKTREFVETMALEMQAIFPKVQAAQLSMPSLSKPVLSFDRRGCSLNFVPENANLIQLRTMLIQIIKENDIEIEPRYIPQSAHVTFLRYLHSLRVPTTDWIEILSNIEISNVRWEISDLWLTWGTNWYGMRDKVKIAGPISV